MRQFLFRRRRAREAAPYFPLGITGLPHAFAQLQVGRSYGATIGHPFARVHLLGRLLFEALQQAPVTVITSRPGESDGVADLLAVVDRCASDVAGAASVAAQLASQRLQILRFRPETVAALAAADEWALLDEFDVRRLRPGGLLLVLDAEQVFSWSRPQLAARQGMAWRLWMMRRRCTSLLVFGADQTGASPVNANYLDRCFGGLVRLETQAGRFSWRIDYWDSPDGAISGREFDLAYDAERTAFVAQGSEISPRDGRLLLAPDQEVVIATADALDNVQEPPSGWKIVAGYDELHRQSADAVAATMLLALSSHDEFEPLLRTVHAIRLRCGRGVKIVVRERRVSLRYVQELLLLRLGADLVVPGSLPFSRLMANLSLLRGQVFARPIEQDFHAAVSSALPSPGRGYLPVAAFCRSVAASLENAARIELPCALIRFSLRRDLPHLDALAACRPKRAGDLFSCDSHSFFLFLFACPEADISAAIDRLFSKPLGDLFDGEVRYTAGDAIEMENRRLEEFARSAGAADFSSALDRLGAVAEDLAAFELPAPPGSVTPPLEPALVSPLVPPLLPPSLPPPLPPLRAMFTRGEATSGDAFPHRARDAGPRRVAAHPLPRQGAPENGTA